MRADEVAWQSAARLLVPPDPVWGGGWRVAAPATARIRHEGRTRRASLEASPTRAAVLDGEVAHVDVEGQSLEFRLARPPTVEEAVRHAAAASGAAVLSAPMPGRVVAVRARAGDAVQAHEPLIVIEAMKMEHAVLSPHSGTLTRLEVAVGDQVQRGATLGEITS